MRTRAVSVIIVLSGAIGAPVLATGGASAHASKASVTASCVHATIGGQRTCLAPGKSCKRKYQRQYEHHGFECVKRNGRYQLQFSGQQQ